MSQPREAPNPYESPHWQASEDGSEALPEDLAGWARRGNLTNDVLVVIAAIVWLVILSGVGTTTASTATSFGEILLGGAIAAWYWIGWGAMLIARLPGQFLGGWVLGRFLRRINPWSVAAGVVICMALATVGLLNMGWPQESRLCGRDRPFGIHGASDRERPCGLTLPVRTGCGSRVVAEDGS